MFTDKFKTIVSKEDAKKIDNSIKEYITLFCKDRNISINSNIFVKLYIEKSRQIYHNLKENSYIGNKQIKLLLDKNKIQIDKISDYSYKNLYPSKWKKFNKDLEILNKDISDFDKEVQATDAFTCNKCKQNICIYSQFQIRSADEPMTLFITCLNPKCGNSWRE
jgi:transcription elongation factor S-II